MQLVFIVSGLATLVALAMAYRWRPTWTRDGIVFAFAVLMFARGLFEGRTDLFYAGLAATSAPFALRAVDKAKERERT
jgi:hypothetical protein